MRVVLYANYDMEPITVLDLDDWAMMHLKKQGYIKIPIPSEIMPLLFTPFSEPPISFSHVCIHAEWFVRNEREHMMLFTSDESSALILKCAFLPGQLAGLQDRERKAFEKGILYAFSQLGKHLRNTS